MKITGHFMISGKPTRKIEDGRYVEREFNAGYVLILSTKGYQRRFYLYWKRLDPYIGHFELQKRIQSRSGFYYGGYRWPKRKYRPIKTYNWKAS